MNHAFMHVHKSMVMLITQVNGDADNSSPTVILSKAHSRLQCQCVMHWVRINREHKAITKPAQSEANPGNYTTCKQCQPFVEAATHRFALLDNTHPHFFTSG
jgi:hypothetical protein